MTLRLGWFTAGRGSGSRAMFERTLAALDDGTLDATVDFVFMHRERGEGEGSDAFMDLAGARGIPVVTHSARRFREAHGGDFAGHRDDYDAQVRELLAPYAPDLCVLAGYLLILSGPMANAYPFVNMHAALPDGPIGLWQPVIWELIADRAAETGAMVFSVTPELDKGPPVASCRFSLAGPRFDGLWTAIEGVGVDALRDIGEKQPLFKAIREEGLRREPLLLVEALSLIAGRANLPSPGGSFGDPQDVTAQVDAALAGRAPRP